MAASISSTSNSLSGHENSIYHLIILSPHDGRLLAVRDLSRAIALPSITIETEVPNWERNCEQIVKVVKDQFGVHGCILGPIWRSANAPDTCEHLVLVMEILDHTSFEGTNDLSWIAREDILKEKWKSLKEEIKTDVLLSSFFQYRTFRHADSKTPIWRTIGWFREVERWIRDVLDSRGLLMLDISHVQNTEDSEVLRVETAVNEAALNTTTQLPSIFYVKTVRQDSFEAILTRKMTGFAGNIVPKVVAVNEEWKTFVQHDAGTPFCRPNPVVLVGELAALQRTSMSHLEELKRLGMHTHSVKWVINNVEKILQHPLVQINGVFADEVSLLRRISAIKCMLQLLNSYSLPNTIVHADLHVGNIAVGEEQGTPSYCIIDWGSAFLGNPLLDVSVLLENLDLEADKNKQTLSHYLHCWDWQIPVLTLRSLLRIANLCYWVLNLYYAIQGCELTPDGERRHLDEVASDILVMSQRLGNIKSLEA